MTPSDVIGQRVNEVRKRRGWSLDTLAKECAKVGMDRLTKNALENIEYGRRDKQGQRRREVTVEELIALALALNVSPLSLIVPPDALKVQITAERDEFAAVARDWFRGLHPLADQDPRLFFAEVPRDESFCYGATPHRTSPPVNTAS